MTVIKFGGMDSTTRGVGERYPMPTRDSSAVPRTAVTPQVSSSPQPAQEFGDGTNDVRYLRITLNAPDDVTAASRLANGYPDTSLLLPGERLAFETDEAITRIDIVAIGDTESGTLAAGELVVEGGGSTEAEFLTAMVTWTFDSADDVRLVNVAASDRYSASAAPATSANYSRVHIEGRSYA